MLTLLRYAYRVVPGTTVATLLLSLVAAGTGALLNLLPDLQVVSEWTLASATAHDLWPRLARPMLEPRRIAHLDDSAVLDEHERARGAHGWAIAHRWSMWWA